MEILYVKGINKLPLRMKQEGILGPYSQSVFFVSFQNEFFYRKQFETTKLENPAVPPRAHKNPCAKQGSPGPCNGLSPGHHRT